MWTLRIAAGLLCLLFSTSVLLAVNPNEAAGAPTNAVLLGGPGGDTISVFSGDMETSVPIGPTWELPGMSWGLSLNYSSKIWRLWFNQSQGQARDSGTLVRRNAFGVGWLLTMGRVYHSCRFGCGPIEEWLYEDQHGTQHPVHLDLASRVGTLIPGQTTDGTYMRVEAYLADANQPVLYWNFQSFKIFPGNGVVMVFDVHPADEAALHPHVDSYDDDHYGLLMRRMEKRAPDATTVYSWVEVSYETSASLGHCIHEIRDGIGSGTTPLRTISFANETTALDAGGVAQSVEGGYTKYVTIPALDVNVASSATYGFAYAPLRTLSFSGGGFSATHANQLLLARVDLPKKPTWAGNYSHNFVYDASTGEMTERAIPTGGQIFYEYATYDYTQAQGLLVVVREVIKKKIPKAGGGYDVWEHTRYRGNSAGATFDIVKDPFGNQTRYNFSLVEFTIGLTQVTETYRGAPLNFGGVFVGPGSLVQKIETSYGNVGTQTVPDVRLFSATTTYVDTLRQSRVVNEGTLPNGHFSKTKEFGFGAGNFPDRITERVYQDPQPGTARFVNWVTEALTDEKIEDGQGHVLRRSQYTYLDDGKLTTARRLADPNGPTSADVVTTVSYDSATGMPDITTVSGGDTGASFSTRATYSGPYLVGKKSLYANLTLFSYFTFDVTRDPRTGLILSQRTPSGIETNFEYDLLGRPTVVNSPLPERPVVTSYVTFLETKTQLEDPSGDKVESRSFLDAWGRPLESRRRTSATVEQSKFTCYDVAGRPTFISEWRTPATAETAGAPPCPQGSIKGTAYDYTNVEDDLLATDPLGRIRKITAADGSKTETSFFALDKTVTSFNINGNPTSGTGTTVSTSYQRDAFGRLVFVDAPTGADGRYTYATTGELTRVELLSSPGYGVPFAQVRTFGYDALGRLRESNNPESGTVLYTAYDAAGNVAEKTESDGRHFTMSYDDAGRLLTVQSAPGTNAPLTLLARYTYDGAGVANGAGRLTQVESFDESGALIARKSLSYDALNGRIGSETTRFAAFDGREGEAAGDPSFTTCYAYSTLGLLDALRYPSTAACDTSPSGVATLKYRYSFGQLKGVNDSRRGTPDPSTPSTWKLINDVVYNEAGGPQEIDYANSVVTTITPDVMFRPSQIKVRGPGGGPSATYLDTGTYSYDGVGNIRTMGADTFGYDPIGRLTSGSIAYNGNTHQMAWTYDDFGNMLREDHTTTPDNHQIPPTTTAKVFQLDPYSNRIVNAGNPSAPFLFDQRGNLRREETKRYLFDDRNRLLSVKSDDRTYPLGEYVYDAGGMRFLKEDPATGRRIFYVRDGGGNVLSEFVPSGAGFDEGFWQKDYFYALGRVIGQAEETAPRPVAGLKSTVTIVGSQSTIALSWSAETEGSVSLKYRIYRKDGSGSWTQRAETALTNPPATSWSENVTLPLSAPLFYRVAALDSLGNESVTSQGVRVEPTAAALSAPSGLSAVADASSVTLRWSRIVEDSEAAAPAPATTFLGHNVYRNTDPNNPASPWVQLNARPLRAAVFHDLGVSQGTAYSYELRAVSTAGAEATGARVSSIPVDGIPPAIPQGVRSLPGPLAGQVTIAWSPNSEDDLLGYRVYRLDPDPNGGQPQWTLRGTAAATATSFIDSGLPQRASYTYAVSAFDLSSASALSSSIDVRPRVSVPGAPMATAAQVLQGWTGTSILMSYNGDGGSAAAYSQFRVYRKEQGLADDRWELLWTAPVNHIAGDPNEGVPPSDAFDAIYLDRFLNQCRVMEYSIGAVDNFGEETEETLVYRSEWGLLPDMPDVSVQQGKVRFDVRGFINCASAGNGFKVNQWKLLEWNSTDSVPHSYTIDPNDGWVLVDGPPSGQNWAYALQATVQNLYETTTPAAPVLYDTYISQDLCVDRNGVIDPSDTACRDLDTSQPLPPPPCNVYTGCSSGGGPVGLDGAWQASGMRMMLYRHNRAALFPPPPGTDAPPAADEPGWRIASLRSQSASTIAGASNSTIMGRPTDWVTNHQADPATLGASLSVVMPDKTKILSPPETPESWISEPSAAFEVEEIGLPSGHSGHWDGRATQPMNSSDLLRIFSGYLGAGRAAAAPTPYAPADPWGWLLHDSPTFGGSGEISLSYSQPQAGGLNLIPMLISGGTTKTFSWEFFHWDHLGSVRVASGAVNGAAIWNARYLPYGQELPGEPLPGSDNTHKFTGHERDGSTGLDYMGARYFGVETTQRFLSIDPSRRSASQILPQTWNRYTYALSNPNTYADPTGEEYVAADERFSAALQRIRKSGSRIGNQVLDTFEKMHDNPCRGRVDNGALWIVEDKAGNAKGEIYKADGSRPTPSEIQVKGGESAHVALAKNTPAKKDSKGNVTSEGEVVVFVGSKEHSNLTSDKSDDEFIEKEIVHETTHENGGTEKAAEQNGVEYQADKEKQKEEKKDGNGGKKSEGGGSDEKKKKS